MHKALGIPEIVYNVVLHLESQDLVRVALVSTAFSRHVQVVLFRHMEIQNWDIPTYYYLRRTLDRQPELLHLIRSVDLTFPKRGVSPSTTTCVPFQVYDELKWGDPGEEMRKKRAMAKRLGLPQKKLKPPEEGAFLTNQEYIGFWMDCYWRERRLGRKQTGPVVAYGRYLFEHDDFCYIQFIEINARLYVHFCRFLIQIPNLRSVTLSYADIIYRDLNQKHFYNIMETNEGWYGKDLGYGFRNLRELNGGDELFCWFLSKTSPHLRLTSVAWTNMQSMKTYFPKEVFHSLTSLKARSWREEYQHWVCDRDVFSQLGSLLYALVHPMQPRRFVFPAIHSLSIGGYFQQKLPSTFLHALMDTPTLKHIKLAIEHSCIEDPMFSRYLESVPKTNFESVTLRIKGNKTMIPDPSLEYLSSCGFSYDSEVTFSDRTWCNFGWGRT